MTNFYANEPDEVYYDPSLDTNNNISWSGSMNNNSSKEREDDEPGDDYDFTLIRNITDISDYILFALSTPSLLANLFVLWASRKLFRKTNDPTHVMVAGMTVADFVLCANQVLRILMQHFFGMHNSADKATQFFVIFHMLAAWTGSSACGLSLLMLNVEKLLYFHWPLHYEQIVTPCKTITGSVALWMSCLTYNVLMIVFAKRSCGDGDFCIVPMSEMYMIYVLAFCIFPILSSGALSVYLWCTVRSKRQCAVTTAANTGSGAGKTKIPVGAQLKTVLFIFTTSIWVVLSWFPARLHFILFIESNVSYILWFGWCTNYLLLLSPLVNPFLTVFVYPCYRKLAKKCAKCSALRGRYQHVDNSIVTNSYHFNNNNNGSAYSPKFTNNHHLVYCPKNSISFDDCDV